MQADDDVHHHMTQRELNGGSTGFHDAIEVPRKTESDELLEEDDERFQRNLNLQSKNSNLVRYKSQK